jgi:hypothetical protein
MPFLTLILRWFCGEVPLVFLGASVGYKCDPIEFPFEPVGDKARQIPPRRPWYKRVLIFLARAILFDGLAFGAFLWRDVIHPSICLAWFPLQSVWFYATDLVRRYCHLCHKVLSLRREDYRWWWSYLTITRAIGL